NLPFGKLMSAVGTSQQVIAAVHQVAHNQQPNGTQQDCPVVVANNFPHLFPVHLLGIHHQQDRDGNEEQPGQDFFRQPPARMRFRHPVFPPSSASTRSWVSISGCTGGSTSASFGVCAGSQPTMAGKWRRKWNTTTPMPTFHQLRFGTMDSSTRT